ncbi:hypothetical protein [Natrinema pallidum]|uniref:hypothetical protein n=1 Tax=Natrinema pallidum TaxID=69527 RepID=UPI0012680788|nr:hypothetical protein [Natrinema pallidum]
MSASDIETVLNTPKLFLFLPAVNYMYIVGTANIKNAFLLCCIATVVSAFLYNTLDGIPMNEATEVRFGLTISFIVGTLIWLYLLVKSAIALQLQFEQSSIIHEILFFATIGFIAVVGTHLILSKFVGVYDNRV